jgi:hypothetical protein
MVECRIPQPAEPSIQQWRSAYSSWLLAEDWQDPETSRAGSPGP